MEIQHYDDQGYFTRTTTAVLDPIDQLPMIPARATAVSLPAGTPEAYQKFHFDGNAFTLVNVPESVAELIATKNDKGTSLYEDVAGDPIARSAEDIAVDDAQYDKDVLKSTAYNSLQTDIYADLNTAFGTKRPETATADYNTYKMMKDKPELFSGELLESEYITASYPSAGTALDSDIKIQTYAMEMIDKVETYAVARMKRKKQYKDEITSIG